jgi:serine/threonine protein phosphatase PrpC
MNRNTNAMHLDIGLGTHLGRRRETNQDTVGHFEPGGLLRRGDGSPFLVVADGMGGHRGGAVASHLAVQAAGKIFQRSAGTTPSEEMLITAVTAANRAVHDKALRTPSLEGMGTTIVAATFEGDSVHIANVGDSRAYIVQGGEIEQITDDHSLIAEQVRVGVLTKEQAAVAVGRNVITRALGRRETLEVDVFSVDWEVGAMLVMCTDGLWGQVSEAQLLTVVLGMEPQPAIEQLTRLALRSHAPDNIGVIIARRME